MQEIGQKWPFLHIIKQIRSLGKSPNNRGRAIFGHEKARTLTPPKLLTKMRKTCVIWQKSAEKHQDLTKICARGGLFRRYFRAISAYFAPKIKEITRDLMRSTPKMG